MFIRLSMIVRPRCRGVRQVAPRLDDAGGLEEAGHQVVGGRERRGAGLLVAGQAPCRDCTTGCRGSRGRGCRGPTPSRIAPREVGGVAERGIAEHVVAGEPPTRATACPGTEARRPAAVAALGHAVRTPGAAGSGRRASCRPGSRSPKRAMLRRTVAIARGQRGAHVDLSRTGVSGRGGKRGHPWRSLSVWSGSFGQSVSRLVRPASTGRSVKRQLAQIGIQRGAAAAARAAIAGRLANRRDLDAATSEADTAVRYQRRTPR